MASHKLHNYLRTYRKHLGLTQSQLAFLVTGGDDKQVSRHENSKYVPTLEAALAYEAVFRIPASELFGGLFEETEDTVRSRIRDLIQQLDRAEPPTIRARMHNQLIIARLENYSLSHKRIDENKTLG